MARNQARARLYRRASEARRVGRSGQRQEHAGELDRLATRQASSLRLQPLDRPAGQARAAAVILRNLGIRQGVTWDTLLSAFLDQSIARPIGMLLGMAELERILKEGRAIIMLDRLEGET